MTPTYIRYPLTNGFVDHWLVAGPQVRLAPPSHTETDLGLLQHFHEATSGVTEPVADLSPLTAPVEGQKPLAWRYYRTLDDHLVDLTKAQAALSHLRAWAYAEIHVPAAQAATLVVSSHGPAEVWLNGQALPPVAHLNPRFVQSTALTVDLQAGANTILVRFEAVGAGPVRHALALRLADVAEAEIALPTNIDPANLEKRQIAEEVVYRAVLDRYVYGQLTGERYEKNAPIPVSFAPGLKGTNKVTFRLQNASGMIYQEASPEAKADTVLQMAGQVPLLFNGLHHLVSMPLAHEYYQLNLRFDRHDPFFYVKTPYTVRGGPDVPARAKEALAEAAGRRGQDVYIELAKMASALWDKVNWKTVQTIIAGIQADAKPDAVFDLLGLLGFLLRYPSKKKQAHLKEVRPALEAAALAFRYWPAEPNEHPASAGAGADFAAEHRQIVYHTVEIMAGQLWPEAVFSVSGQTGAWHRAHGEGLALAWLRQRGGLGFQEWDSPVSLDAVVAALTHLVDLAEAEPVAELAAILLDKVFFSLAINSFQGAHTGTQGRADTESVLSGRLAATSGLARLLWGQGNFNHHLRGLISLACCREYQLPDLIRQIATQPVDVLWNMERNVLPAGAAGAQPWEVSKVTYKTKNFMLACAQDYQAGQPGTREHIWQATLGPDAVVFVNHPTTLALDDAHQPNLWVGNGVLPRAAQWGDVLMAIHQLPADDWLGFTHAYFPARVFDEHAFAGQWAFARTGDGYLALTAARGFTQITTGPTAFRELRSPGLSNVWLCHMGQPLLDGSFEDFQQKILALDIQWADAGVQLTSLRGEKLAFGWTGPLVVNGDAQPLVNPRHIENPYCVAELAATQIDVIYQGEGVRLTFS